jgi:hypothetical protein
MRLVKLVIISLFVLSGIITGISALFPSTVIVSRVVEVKATPTQIAYYVTDLNHWNAWMSDWKENTVTKKDSIVSIGTQTIRPVSKTDSAVVFEWIATGQRPYQVQIEWINLTGGVYAIHWSFEQHVKWYPWEKFQTLLNEKVLGAKMEIELANLREVLLNDPEKQ